MSPPLILMLVPPAPTCGPKYARIWLSGTPTPMVGSMQCAAVTTTRGETRVPVQKDEVPLRWRPTTAGWPGSGAPFTMGELRCAAGSGVVVHAARIRSGAQVLIDGIVSECAADSR